MNEYTLYVTTVTQCFHQRFTLKYRYTCPGLRPASAAHGCGSEAIHNVESHLTVLFIITCNWETLLFQLPTMI